MIKGLKQKPKVIIQFEPDPNFEDVFLEFIEEILSWSTTKEQLKVESNEKTKTA